MLYTGSPDIWKGCCYGMSFLRTVRGRRPCDPTRRMLIFVCRCNVFHYHVLIEPDECHILPCKNGSCSLLVGLTYWSESRFSRYASWKCSSPMRQIVINHFFLGGAKVLERDIQNSVSEVCQAVALRICWNSWLPRSTSILVARLILNLRVAAARQAGGPTLSVEQMSLSWAQSPAYSSALSDAILGNIGNDLEYEIDADSSSDYEHS